MSMPHGKLETQTLCNQEFQVNHVRGDSAFDVRGISFQRYRIVRGLSGQKEGGEPNVSTEINIY